MPTPRRLLAAAPLCALLFATSCTRSAPRDPEVVRLVEAVAHDEERIESIGDDGAPEELVELIGRGPAAVPTLLDMLATATDDGTLRVVLEVLVRIGDPRAREPIERLLARPTGAIPDGALEAIERLGQRQSAPALRALLARPDRGGHGRARLLGALLRLGDESALEPLIDHAIADAGERFDAVDALVHHAPLCEALGLQPPGSIVPSVGDDLLFLHAAKEWVLERRGEPSPWKARADFEFREPFASEKQRAFGMVSEVSDVARGGVRFLPVDVEAPAAAQREPVAVLYGWGHAHSLHFDVWQPRGDGVRLHRFSIQAGAEHSGFPENSMRASYAAGEVPAAVLQRVLAGVHAALATRVLEWWNGPNQGVWSSTSDFAVAFVGVVPEQTPGFCGYESQRALLGYATLAAARDWHQHLASDVPLHSATPAAEERALFADLWRRCRDRWNDEGWGFVRERLVAMAGPFGDASLVPMLLEHVAPDLVEVPHSPYRTAAHACTSLAAITGQDLRFDDTGAPRAVADVARDYRERFAR